jgi:hypothetical protein
MKIDEEKVEESKAELLKIGSKTTSLVLPEGFDGLEKKNGFRKMIAYAIHSKYTWVHSDFRLKHGKNSKKKK